MIHAIGVALEKNLRAKGCPFPVVDGPEDTKTAQTFARERIVIERFGGDAFVEANGTRGIAVKRGPHNRDLGVKLSIYARCPASGAMPFEHQDRADHVVDMLIVALHEVFASDELRARHALKSGGFVPLPDLAASERASGALYEMRFTVLRSTRELTWKGQGPDTVTVGAASAEGVVPIANPTMTVNGG